MTSYINLNDRIECNDIEFRSGDQIEVYITNQWLQTCIEHDGQQYYSTDGYPLIGHQIRHLKIHSTHHVN